MIVFTYIGIGATVVVLFAVLEKVPGWIRTYKSRKYSRDHPDEPLPYD